MNLIQEQTNFKYFMNYVVNTTYTILMKFTKVVNKSNWGIVSIVTYEGGHSNITMNKTKFDVYKSKYMK